MGVEEEVRVDRLGVVATQECEQPKVRLIDLGWGQSPLVKDLRLELQAFANSPISPHNLISLQA